MNCRSLAGALGGNRRLRLTQGLEPGEKLALVAFHSLEEVATSIR
jgi:hypothetical protein